MEYFGLKSPRYSLVPIRKHGSINWHTSFIWPCTFPKILGMTISWINTQFWSTSRGTIDKNNLAPTYSIILCRYVLSINWIVTFSMPWGMTSYWNMSSNWHQRVHLFKDLSSADVEGIFMHLKNKCFQISSNLFSTNIMFHYSWMHLCVFCIDLKSIPISQNLQIITHLHLSKLCFNCIWACTQTLNEVDYLVSILVLL